MIDTKTPARPSTPRFALLVLLGAYPVITAVLYIIAPLASGWPIWQRTLLVAPMMVATMVWGVIPVVHKRFQWFITPSSRAALKTVAIIAGSIGALGLPVREAASQSTPRPPSRWEFSVPSGVLVPTGDQGARLKRADLTAIQLSWLPRPSLALTTMAGWARSRDLSTPGDPKLDVFMYDVGAELRGPGHEIGRGVTIYSFAGTGVGGRSYDYRGIDADASHNLAAYGAIGSEFGAGRFRLRFEARDYLTGFKSLGGPGRPDSRNDVVVMAGLRFVGR